MTYAAANVEADDANLGSALYHPLYAEYCISIYLFLNCSDLLLSASNHCCCILFLSSSQVGSALRGMELFGTKGALSGPRERRRSTVGLWSGRLPFSLCYYCGSYVRWKILDLCSRLYYSCMYVD